jgi:hypothetical protein
LDHIEAVRWYRAAAEQGDPLGQHALGAMYAMGQGVEQDFIEAMRWYRRSAEQGNPNSQTSIGWMYEKGEGVAPDIEQALKWYELAAEQGDERAQQHLERINSMAAIGDVTDDLVGAYLTAPAEALAMSRSRLVTLSMMVSSGFGVQHGDEEINDENREEVAQGINAKLIAQQIAMNRRGYRDIRGRYTATATGSCSKIQSGWADGIAQGMFADATINQDEHEFKIVQALKVKDDEEHAIETPGVIVEDALAFADLMNSDFMYSGHISDDTIVIAPDTDFILDAWPHWVKAPERKDLDRCEIKLLRIRPSDNAGPD